MEWNSTEENGIPRKGMKSHGRRDALRIKGIPLEEKGEFSLPRMKPKTLIIIKIMRNLYLSHYFSVTLHCNM